jgi:hypothetical protein
MVRPELHQTRRLPDALARPPARPHFDAIAWRAAQAESERRTTEAVTALLAILAQGAPERALVEKQARAA